LESRNPPCINHPCTKDEARKHNGKSKGLSKGLMEKKKQETLEREIQAEEKWHSSNAEKKQSKSTCLPILT
jgi:hypothetical protein